MKKIFLLVFIACLFTACSDSDDEVVKGQDYTSFVITTESMNPYTNGVAGYLLENGTFKRLAVIESISKGQFSKEIKVDNNISSIYLFGENAGNTYVFDQSFILKNKEKNIITITSEMNNNTKIVDNTDSKQYPIN